MRAAGSGYALLLAAAFGSACTGTIGGRDPGSDASADGSSSAGGSGGDDDASVAPGTLVFDSNLPSGLRPSVTVRGPGGTRTITESSVSLPPGTYTLEVGAVRQPGTFVDTLWDGTPSRETVSVESNATSTVTLTYAPRPGTGHIWVANAQAHTLVAYSDATLAGRNAGVPDGGSPDGGADASASDAGAGNAGADAGAGDAGVPLPVTPDVVLSNPPPGDAGVTRVFDYPTSVAFDGSGNLWVTNCGAPLARIAADQLAESGSPAPELEIPMGDACPLDLAFNADGWLALAAIPVLLFPPSELTATGTPVLIGEGLIENAEGVAFDDDGNLWVADYDTNSVYRWDAADLTSAGPDAGGGPAPAQTWTGLTGAVGVAFDATRNVWITQFSQNTYTRVAASDVNEPDLVTSLLLSGAGSTVGPEKPAFDVAGNLWVPDWSGDALVRIPSAALTQTSDVDGGLAGIEGSVLVDFTLSSPFKVTLNPPPANVPIF